MRYKTIIVKATSRLAIIAVMQSVAPLRKIMALEMRQTIALFFAAVMHRLQASTDMEKS